MSTRQAVPAGVRSFLLALVTVLAVASAIGNLGHGFEFATKTTQGKQDVFMGAVSALLPDALIVIGVFLWLYGQRWLGALLGASGVGFMVWAACSLESTSTARIVAAWPVYGAVLGAWALHTILSVEQSRPAPGATPTTDGRTPAPARPATRRPPRRPASAPEPTVSTLLPSDAPLTDQLPVLPATPKEPVPVVEVEKPSRPSRERAREILADLGDKLDATSNAQLSRMHGGSDVWWGQQRKAYLDDRALVEELDALGTELPVE